MASLMSGDKVLLVFLFVSVSASSSFASNLAPFPDSISSHMLDIRQAGDQPPCNFVQFLTFVNTSQCYRDILTDAIQMNSVGNGERPGQLAEQYCTQSCAGNFISFIQNEWECDVMELKESFRLILDSVCSKNLAGRRCVTYSVDDLVSVMCESAVNLTNFNCSSECRRSLLSTVDDAGCCFSTQVDLLRVGGADVIDTALNSCDINLSAACPLDYETEMTIKTETPGSGSGINSVSLGLLIASLCSVLVHLSAEQNT